MLSCWIQNQIHLLCKLQMNIVAGFDDIEAYLELVRKTDVITFEFEHFIVKYWPRLKMKAIG